MASPSNADAAGPHADAADPPDDAVDPPDKSPAGAPTGGPRRPDVAYKGAPLDPERGPGLGCFWLQVVALTVAVVLTPLSAAWEWPVLVTIFLLASTLVLLLFVGQTVIFLLRLVAADRRQDARRRPLRSGTKTVGELEDEAGAADGPDHAHASPDERSGRDEPG